jgi:hypothetical protein
MCVLKKCTLDGPFTNFLQDKRQQIRYRQKEAKVLYLFIFVVFEWMLPRIPAIHIELR